MKRRPSYRRHVASPWTLSRVLAVLAVVFLLAASPAVAESVGKRPIRVAPVMGARVFADPLKLRSEFAFGVRISMGVSERVSIVMDAGHSSPVRKTSGQDMSFGDIRLLSTVALLRSPLRPYVVGGLGGQFFNFYDTPGTAGLVFAGGLGVEYAPAARWSAFAEASADAYRASFTIFNSSRYLDYESPRQTLVTGVFTFGVQYEF